MMADVTRAHGFWPPPLIEALLSDDPDLENVTADMGAWMEAHPCECEATCECDQEKEEEEDD